MLSLADLEEFLSSLRKALLRSYREPNDLCASWYPPPKATSRTRDRFTQYAQHNNSTVGFVRMRLFKRDEDIHWGADIFNYFFVQSEHADLFRLLFHAVLWDYIRHHRDPAKLSHSIFCPWWTVTPKLIRMTFHAHNDDMLVAMQSRHAATPKNREMRYIEYNLTDHSVKVLCRFVVDISQMQDMRLQIFEALRTSPGDGAGGGNDSTAEDTAAFLKRICSVIAGSSN